VAHITDPAESVSTNRIEPRGRPLLKPISN
jgi:hypothetical protein